MKKILILLAAMLMLVASNAQTDTTESVYSFFPPDYSHIKQVMNDKQSPQYLPRLAKMLENADTNLSFEDLQVLYFGQSLKDNYNPYENMDQVAEIRTLLNKDDISKKDAEKVLSLCNEIIKINPAEPRAYWYRYIGYNILARNYGGDTTMIDKADLQLRMVLAAIRSTGDGTSTATAMHVTHTAHEYFLLMLFDFDFAGQSLMYDKGHAYDEMQVKENPYDLDALYFNIDAIVSHWGKRVEKPQLSDKPVSEITVSLGSKFILEMVKEGKKKSTFKIVSVESVADTISNDDPALFPDSIPDNQIIGYFCMTKVFSSGANPCLITKKGNQAMYSMDTEIEYRHDGKFHSTSNEGIIGTAQGTEIWNDPITRIRISKIRK